ncbi:predicted protein [Plenodomus lingam JN3]|uniref:Predicted protein n=1 Tax=Leptosphaeria maculans (strain JN3 / isolate v23.1.3 / race Av1-4-5-6-7-8) TaxID=985895 RepID=E5A8G7_LEPMJ|nr:predicted protein [Plenodomus lingam JN3]CBX99912.1 predicted protein [Plenodomus lingam JN3]
MDITEREQQTRTFIKTPATMTSVSRVPRHTCHLSHDLFGLGVC